LHNLGKVLSTRTTLRLIGRKLLRDRVLVRASALSYDSLLALVPLLAVSMGSVGVLGGRDTLGELLRDMASYYVPTSAGPAIEHMIALAETLDFHAIGLVGLLALLPVVFALVDAVEHALADVFGMPRRTHWWRLLMLGGLLSLGPLGLVLSVRYMPLAGYALHQVLTPFLIMSVLLYLVFRWLPRLRVTRRAAGVGALSAAVVVAIAKIGFGIYAQLAVSLHALWGAITFVPLFLVWILLCWYAVLCAAAVSSVVHAELLLREQPRANQRERKRKPRSRLRQRMSQRNSLPGGISTDT
jgi:membrane protein